MGGVKARPIEELFWPKVEKTDGCWNWLAGTANGYGRFNTRLAHRVCWELVNGPLEKGTQLDHVCRNRACVSPAHLRIVTNKENAENHDGPKSNSKSGIRGVYWNKAVGKWHGQVTHNGHQYSLSYFEDIKDAEKAVIAKRLELFTHNDSDRRAAA